MTSRKLIYLLLFMFMFSILAPPAGAAPAGGPKPVGEAALLMDGDTGQVLFEKNADRQMYPASTTKIITALLALEKSSPEEVVTVSRRAAEIGGTRVGLQPGEHIKMEQLVYILMLSSANDAGVAIAEHVGGSVEEFARMMTDRARQAGARHTNFTNPHGMPDEQHYTTARDLALISREAMQNSEFRKIARTVNYKAQRKENMTPEVLDQVQNLERIYGPVQEDFFNHNKLLWSGYYGYKGANGIKTGYTTDAGQCIAASARRGERELIAVVLNSQGANLWTDASMLLDYGFDNFIPVELAKPREMITSAEVKYGSSHVVLETSGFYYYNFPVGEKPEVSRRIVLNQNITAPVQEGELMGHLVLEADGRQLGQVPLVAVYPVERKFSSNWWFWVASISAVLVMVRLAVARLRRRRRLVSRRVFMRKRGNW